MAKTFLWNFRSVGALVAGSVGLVASPTFAQQEPVPFIEYPMVPYSANQLIVVRQINDAQNQEDSQGSFGAYVTIYRLPLAELTGTEDGPACQELHQNSSKAVRFHIFRTNPEQEFEPRFEAAHCLDLNSDHLPEDFFKVWDPMYGQHGGTFLFASGPYGPHGPVVDLFATPDNTMMSDRIKTSGERSSGWLDLYNLSYSAGVDTKSVTLQKLGFDPGSQKYLTQEVQTETLPFIYSTQHQTPLRADYNYSRVNPPVVLDRAGRWMAMLYEEGNWQQLTRTDAFLLFDFQTQRQFTLVPSAIAGFRAYIQQRYPLYKTYLNAARFVFEPVGFNQQTLIFKGEVLADCDGSSQQPACAKAFGENTNQFIGYWSYSPESGALRLLAGQPNAGLTVEHTGYIADLMVPETGSPDAGE